MEHELSTGAFESPRDYRDVPLASVGPEEDSVYAASLPDSYLVDVSKLPVWHQRKIGACFPAGTIISMADGSYKDIEKVEIGEYVLNADGLPARVEETMSRKWQGNLIEITPYGMPPILATPEHPFLTNRGWVQARELSTDDYVKIPVRKDKRDTARTEIERDPGFLRLLGMYLAEGSITRVANSVRITWSLNKKERSLALFIEDTCRRLFSVETHITQKKESHGMDIRCSSRLLGDLLEELGGKLCDKKEIHQRLLSIDPNLQLDILKGWLLGDGTFLKPAISGVSVSKSLVYQMYDIASRNGLTPSIRLPKIYGNRKQAYIFTINGKDNYWFFPDKYLPKNVRRCDSWRGINNPGEDFYRRIRVKKKLRAGKELKQPWKTVYNLEVSNGHTYVAGFAAVHNCVGHAAGKYKQLIDLRETGQVIEYSPRFLYAIAKARDGHQSEGTYPRIVAKILKDIGCPTENEVPNDTTLDHESYVYGRDESKVPGKKEAAPGQIGGYAFLDTQSVISLKKAITEYGGAMFLMRIDRAWWTKKDGTPSWTGSEIVPLRAPTGDISGHEVYLYGYEDVVENGRTRTKFFIFNSWSVDWGLSGRAWFYHDEYKPWLIEAITFVDLPNDIKKRLSELPDAKTFKYTFNVDIKVGQRGEDVEALQTALMIDGNFSRDLYAELLREDALGYFKPGGVTQKALLDFQLEYLVPGVSTRKDIINLNGTVCGPKTRKVLNQLYAQ